MDVEHEVARHYSHGNLEQAILDALKAGGKAIEKLAPSDLSGADEFHLGWRAATAALAVDMDLTADLQLLDIGAGIGGPARFFADAHGTHVTGIDLSEEYVRVASSLTHRCGLSGRVRFRQASALDLPFQDGSFDAATLIHVGMNIADKAGLFGEVRRVLKSGACFGIYDVMRMTGDEIPYPMPWAQTPDTSFVETPDTYRTLLTAAGFTVEQEANRRAFTLERWRQMQEQAAAHGPQPLSLHTLIGPASRERLGNVMTVLQQGTIAPIQMIARAA
ncbi:MAG TPA: class I SAM-dependent methyltransferase [Geminicoccus sp.]|jgi:ubiquinone/menaquinone biosynthesis C-methylase UbiE|uniref:class I SAM-dependent methyltransferase n=1 Tax=Geminicoccus sp. TaxID=2024832 RepID=UPI002E2F8116|nr:class I SAM-dependent methyltransferase [Geminicoccus sp.]HEX2525159.1 class I SAM-dependent methyltransferase [Geminicoccus sp.]